MDKLAQQIEELKKELLTLEETHKKVSFKIKQIKSLIRKYEQTKEAIGND